MDKEFRESRANRGRRVRRERRETPGHKVNAANVAPKAMLVSKVNVGRKVLPEPMEPLALLARLAQPERLAHKGLLDAMGKTVQTANAGLGVSRG